MENSTPAFYTPTYTALRPCEFHMFVPDAALAIITPSGWTKSKTVPVDQIYMKDEVEPVPGAKFMSSYQNKEAPNAL